MSQIYQGDNKKLLSFCENNRLLLKSFLLCEEFSRVTCEINTPVVTGRTVK